MVDLGYRRVAPGAGMVLTLHSPADHACLHLRIQFFGDADDNGYALTARPMSLLPPTQVLLHTVRREVPMAVGKPCREGKPAMALE